MKKKLHLDTSQMVKFVPSFSPRVKCYPSFAFLLEISWSEPAHKVRQKLAKFCQKLGPRLLAKFEIGLQNQKQDPKKPNKSVFKIMFVEKKVLSHFFKNVQEIIP